VADVSAERILGLRIVDPAMGSGAFLVEACRFLARAYEAALVREGQLGETDASPADRAAFRRLVAQRCLFGVDLNPMAVHLARLSLWLTTLAADKPLSFLDHHLLAGDSLLGAAPSDIARRVPRRARARRAGDDQLPLFDSALLREAAATVQLVRRDLEHTPARSSS
jgi:type II restriction/modification system DNA methylase subunit YeeA